MQELEAALAQQAPPQTQDDPTLHELPPLVIDGIPTPVEKMTQVFYCSFDFCNISKCLNVFQLE